MGERSPMDDDLHRTLCEAIGSWPDEMHRRYELVDILGMGGMGVVLRATDRKLNRTVAIKAARLCGVDDADHELRARMRREMKLHKELAHPAIVRLLDGMLWPEGEALILEWVKGRPLTVPMPAPWTHHDSLRFMAAVADGMAHAHELGILHRDLKPENLLVTPDGGPKILDLGLAQGFGTRDDTILTRTGYLVGTPAWLPPENLRGDPFLPESDVFQLGLITQDLLSGTRHQDGYAPDMALRGRMHPHIVAGAFIPRNLDPDLHALLLRSVAGRPKIAPRPPPSATPSRASSPRSVPSSPPRVTPKPPPRAPMPRRHPRPPRTPAPRPRLPRQRHHGTAFSCPASPVSACSPSWPPSPGLPSPPWPSRSCRSAPPGGPST